MKRWIPLCVAFLFGGVVLLSRTAISYEDFTGTWYSCSSGEGYLFSQGIIVCQENAIGLFQIPLFFSEMHCPGSGPVTEGAAPASCGITVGTGEPCIDAHPVNPLSVTRDKIV